MKEEEFHEIAEYLRTVIKGTPFEGNLYAVGGCCRDIIAGDPIKDIDLAVSLPNGGISFARFMQKRHLVTGLPVFFRKFGTARFQLKRYPGLDLEVVQTRKANYTPEIKANPALAFGSVENDCIRRDLTINTLYYNISTGEMLDITGKGVEDIKARRLRTPGPPEEVYQDDPLRIMRTIRFMGVYNVDVDRPTAEAMERWIVDLHNTSVERLHHEFDRILTLRNLSSLDRLYRIGGLEVLFPTMVKGIKSNGGEECWKRIIDALGATDNDDIHLRWAILLLYSFSDLSKPLIDNSLGISVSGRRIMRDYHYEQNDVARVMKLVAYLFPLLQQKPLSDRRIRQIQLEADTRECFDNILYICGDFASRLGLVSQVEDVRKRTAAMDGNGTSMFGYKLPLTDTEIRKMKNLPRNADLTRYHARLRKYACSHPGFGSASARKLLEGFNPPVRTVNRPSGRKHQPRRRSQRFKNIQR